jgi:hypothetical protein
MKKGEKKKQHKMLKRRSASSMQRRTQRASSAVSPLHYVRQARSYPLDGCWIQKDWKESGLAVIVIARRQPNGNIVFGNYLVDYYCLGLKNTYCNADVAPGEFQHSTLPRMFEHVGQFVEVSPALAHELIYGAIEYADRYGFKPQRDFRDSQYVLDLPGEHPRSGKVEFGKDGKPLYISSPYDNADRIIQQLMRTAGAGNFDYLMQVGDDEEVFVDDDFIDDDFEEDAET